MINLIQVLDAASFCEETAELWHVVGSVVTVIQWAIPAIIVLLGTIDLGKAVIAGEEKQIKEAQGIFIKRLIYGIVVFFVVMIVKAVFGAVGKGGATGNVCFTCVADTSACPK